MKTQKKTITLALALLALVAFAGPVAANHDAVVDNLRIAVLDHNGNEVTVISPDQVVPLPHDSPLQLRMFTQVGNERVYLPTEFRVARGSERVLNHTRNRQDRGEVTLAIHPNADTSGQSYLQYTLRNDVRLADERMRSGLIRVEVDEGGLGQVEADRLIAALYRGVLLREPDQQGLVSARQALQTGGWNGLLRFAQNLATSRESEMDVYANGTCNQARLIAMYRELQGRDLRRVDQRAWRAQLEQMDRGDVDGVLMAMMESAEFQDRFGLRTASMR